MEINNTAFWAGILVALIVGVTYVVNLCLCRINEGFIGVATKFGKPECLANGKLKLYDPGLHFHAPWTQMKIMSAMEQLVDLNELQAIASDGTTLRVDAKLRMSISRDSIFSYLFDLKQPAAHIKNLFTCLLRGEVANFKAKLNSAGQKISHDDISFVGLRQNRLEFNNCLQEVCVDRFNQCYGVTFRSADVTNIKPPPELDSALNAVQSAQAEAATLKLRTQSACEQKVVAASENVEIAREHATATETEIKTLGNILHDLKLKNTLQSYLERRRSEVVANSKLLFFKN